MCRGRVFPSPPSLVCHHKSLGLNRVQLGSAHLGSPGHLYSESGRARWPCVLKVMLAVVWAFSPS